MRHIIRTLILSIALISGMSATAQETRGTIEETGGNIKVLLETASWGQNHPFNNQCWTKPGGTTHAKTGCVATAYAIVTTGQKATDVIVETFGCEEPAVGSSSNIRCGEKELHFWRMPSSSRAYPLALDKKASFYRKMLSNENIK